MSADLKLVGDEVAVLERSLKPVQDMFNFAFDRVKADHAELTDLWKQLDGKSQATATISGGFLAAAFAGIKSTSIVLLFPEKVMLLAAITMLIGSIAGAVRAMVIRNIPSPPAPDAISEMLDNILAASPEDYERRHIALIADTINLWLPQNRMLHEMTRKKAVGVALAQTLLAVAMGIFAIQTFFTVLTR